jgi:hypothetical protein
MEMKKIWFVVMALLLLALTGCATNAASEGNDDYYVPQGDGCGLEAAEEIDIPLIAENIALEAVL